MNNNLQLIKQRILIFISIYLIFILTSCNLFNKNNNNLKSEFLIPDLVFKQIKMENIKVEVIETNARWLGVTYKEDKENVVASLRKLVDNGEYKKGLW